MPKSVCISVPISLISELLVWNVASSAKKSEKQYFSKRGTSLMNNRNKVGLSIEPCGTPDRMVANADIPEWLQMRTSLNHYLSFAHNRLLYKLSSYGVKGNTLGWIGSFLSGRSQKVVLEGKSSSSVPVLSGVPQGSVLSPILFFIYINDLPEYVSNTTVRLFADDTLLYLTIHNSSDCDKLWEDLNYLESWKSDWQMSFHPEKCEVIHITTKKTPILHSYSLHGHILYSVPQIKYPGVHISQDLKWNSHINSTSSKANQTLGFLKRNLRIN